MGYGDEPAEEAPVATEEVAVVVEETSTEETIEG